MSARMEPGGAATHLWGKESVDVMETSSEHTLAGGVTKCCEWQLEWRIVASINAQDMGNAGVGVEMNAGRSAGGGSGNGSAAGMMSGTGSGRESLYRDTVGNVVSVVVGLRTVPTVGVTASCHAGVAAGGHSC